MMGSLQGILLDAKLLPFISVITLFLLALTVIAGFLSSYATAKSNELKLLPLLILYFRGKFAIDRGIYLKNTGFGTAFNIEINPFTIFITDRQEIYTLTFSIKGTNLLAPIDGEIPLNIQATSKQGGAVDKDFLQFHLDPEEEHDRKPVRLDITYKNASGNKYYQLIETGNDGLKIVQAPKIYDLQADLFSFFTRVRNLAFEKFYTKFLWKIRKKYSHVNGAPIPEFKYAFLNKLAKVYFRGSTIK